MVFSSPLFVFMFLPIVLVINSFLNNKLSNIFLCIVSLAFYAWGERVYFILMGFSILVNYYLGLFIERKPDNKKIIIGIGVVVNLSLLAYFKYANFFIVNVNIFLSNFGNGFVINEIKGLSLPIGISFFTFHGLSYLIDVYRNKTTAQTSIIKLGLYISLFPQLIAGPIVRYHNISRQLSERIILPDNFRIGIERFVIGLAKKLILANSFAYIADYIFPLQMDQVSTGLAWMGIIAYTLQIYYDFSGYSDMAIGLARMLGFDFLENFNYPYIANSIKDFWRRWHISLSSWFRDYLYIPIGGSKVNEGRTYFNLFLVFFVTGLWHGASVNFIVWGLFHGFFLIIERLFLGNMLEKTGKLFSHVYTLLVVVSAWVFFRAENINMALSYLEKMYTYCPETIASRSHINFLLTPELGLLAPLGFLFTTPVIKKLSEYIHKSGVLVNAIYYFLIFGLLILCFTYLAAGTYNPFIYFRF
jgi:alginate O-acetyltransferase complex protein AlgI